MAAPSRPDRKPRHSGRLSWYLLVLIGAESQAEGLGDLVHGGEVQGPLLLQEALDRVDGGPGLLGDGLRRPAAPLDCLAQSFADRPLLPALDLLRAHRRDPPSPDRPRPGTLALLC